uniref:Small nuclear ribonucleoprotein Sm D2 n=1 Tax=Ailuropoda melanoleuca TaxID=9646 RepID=A0A7N5JE90_AILME
MVVENVKEMWTKVPKSGKAKKKYKPVNKDCYIYKMFLTWDSDIMPASSSPTLPACVPSLAGCLYLCQINK